MNHIHSGTVGEIKVAELFLKNGFDVFRSISTNSYFDMFVFDRDRGYEFKIEVKVASLPKSGLGGSIQISNHRLEAHDIIAVYVKEIDMCFFFDSWHTGGSFKIKDYDMCKSLKGVGLSYNPEGYKHVLRMEKEHFRSYIESNSNKIKKLEKSIRKLKPEPEVKDDIPF